KILKQLLKSDSENSLENEIKFETILNYCFRLEFKELKNELDSWHPDSHWVLKKAGLLSLFNRADAKDLLWSHYIHSELETNQEQFYCLQLLNYIKQNIDFRFDKELNEKIRLYKNSGL